METFSALLQLYAGNSPVTGEFPSQRPVMRIFDVFYDLRLNKRLSKQSWGWWFETSSRSLLRHCNVMIKCNVILAKLWSLAQCMKPPVAHLLNSPDFGLNYLEMVVSYLKLQWNVKATNLWANWSWLEVSCTAVATPEVVNWTTPSAVSDKNLPKWRYFCFKVVNNTKNSGSRNTK